jgi:hypothetical protein
MSASVHAAIPLMINHQGYVRVDGEPFTGTGQFKFGLYDADTNQWIWTNDEALSSGENTISPSKTISLSVDTGYYNVILGDTGEIDMASLPSTIFESDNIRLRIWFDDGVNGEEELGDQRFTSSAYSFHAASADRADTAAIADGVVAGAVTSAMILNGAVGSNDIATGAVTATKIADSSITSEKFDANAVAPNAAQAEVANHAMTAVEAEHLGTFNHAFSEGTGNPYTVVCSSVSDLYEDDADVPNLTATITTTTGGPIIVQLVGQEDQGGNQGNRFRLIATGACRLRIFRALGDSVTQNDCGQDDDDSLVEVYGTIMSGITPNMSYLDIPTTSVFAIDTRVEPNRTYTYKVKASKDTSSDTFQIASTRLLVYELPFAP